MPFLNTPVAFAALSADGNADGYVTVASNEAFYPGARVWLLSNVVASKEYLVTNLSGATLIGLREVRDRDGGHRYGRTPVTQWKVAEAATISQEAQVVDVELANLTKVSKPV
jgi:hypothetical protein